MRNHIRILTGGCLTVFLSLVHPVNAADKAAAPAPGSPWGFTASATVKEGFDGNVFLQSVGPKADEESFITTLIPALGVTFKPDAAFNASLNYAPEVSFFHSASSEDHVLHRTGLTLGGKVRNTGWEITESFIAIDGSDTGPTYLQPGGAPAGGGPAVRDRRDAFIQRGQFRLTQTLGDWFIRPVVSGYYHDFRTIQKTNAGYQNFVDRNDFNGGVDAGYSIAKEAWLTAGYRYGVQKEAKLFPGASAASQIHYNSTYHRVLVGIEGKPASWLKLGISIGPEFRRYGEQILAGADRDEVYPFVDATATFTPTRSDTFTLTARSFEQPGFAGRSAYIDSTYELVWRHKFSDAWTIGVAGRGYNTDFLEPTKRNDWIITGSAMVSYTFNKRLTVEGAYGHDDARSVIPDMPGREYTRHYMAVTLKYIFK